MQSDRMPTGWVRAISLRRSRRPWLFCRVRHQKPRSGGGLPDFQLGPRLFWPHHFTVAVTVVWKTTVSQRGACDLVNGLARPNVESVYACYPSTRTSKQVGSSISTTWSTIRRRSLRYPGEFVGKCDGGEGPSPRQQRRRRDIHCWCSNGGNSIRDTISPMLHRIRKMGMSFPLLPRSGIRPATWHTTWQP
jgi:hypothetical protein